MLISSLDAGPWSYSLPAVRTVNFYMESLPAPPGPAESSPHPLLSPSPRIHPQTAGASSPSTSPSSLGAKLLTSLPSAAPQTAMQACTHPCHRSARPPWTSTNCMCPALSQAKSQTRERTRRTRRRTLRHPNKVGRRARPRWITPILICCSDVFNDPRDSVDADLSVREESDNDPNQSDDGDAEASPTKSPTTPKNLKCKNSSGTSCPRYVHDSMVSYTKLGTCHLYPAPQPVHHWASHSISFDHSSRLIQGWKQSYSYSELVV